MDGAFLPSAARREALLFGGSYAVIGILWVLFSDNLLLAYSRDPEFLSNVQTLKGIAVILVTAGFLAYVVFQRVQKVAFVTSQLSNSLASAAETKKLNHEIAVRKRLERQLRAARDRAQNADSTKSRFLAAASHDLRQPLHALTLFTRALSRRVDGEEAQRLINNMNDSLRALKVMFNALLDVSRLDSGLYEPQPTIFRSGEVCQQVANEFALVAAERGLEFKSRLQVGHCLHTDRAILETILRNLTANAVKFTEQGKVLMASRKRGNSLRFEIYDTGTGIPSERLDEVFLEFERSTQDAKGRNEGLGLGLALVRRYAEVLGLKLKVRSNVGKGSCFMLEVPIVDCTTDQKSGQQPDEETASALSGSRVLILEDDPLVLDALKGELLDLGCEVRTAATTEDAEALCIGGNHPDLVIADYHLAGAETGLAFINRMENERGLECHALIISGGTDADTLTALSRSGRPWFTKPVDPDVLAASLTGLLHKNSG